MNNGQSARGHVRITPVHTRAQRSPHAPAVDARIANARTTGETHRINGEGVRLGAPGLTLATPITDDAHALVGVLTVDFDLRETISSSSTSSCSRPDSRLLSSIGATARDV
jgi:hypothetical protein